MFSHIQRILYIIRVFYIALMYPHLTEALIVSAKLL